MNKNQIVVIVLSIVAAALLGVLIYITVDRNALINDLTFEKETLTQQMVELQDEYSILSTNNDSLNVQLDREKEKVGQLIDRMKKTEATNRSKMRQYEKELGTLRSIMKHYIVQIDSLNTLNSELRKETQLAKERASKAERESQRIAKTNQEYAKQIEKGSVIKGRGVNIIAINSSDKETNRSSRTKKLRTCLNLIENTIATKGPMDVYIRVKGPDGILMTGDQQQIADIAGERMIYSASREVDYQGAEVEVCIYFTHNQKFAKGVYTVDIYAQDGKLGTAELELR